MLKEIFHDSFENFEITGTCMENYASMTGWQKLFFHTNASNFRQRLQSLLLRYTAENSQVNYLILICSLSLCLQNFSEVNCFRVYWKLITWSSHAKSLFGLWQVTLGLAREGGMVTGFILLHEKFLQFDWLRAVVFQLNL